MTEAEIMREIMLALSADGHVIFRANVGLFYTADGRAIRTGLPFGFTDLFGYRWRDQKAIFIEVKTATGRVSKEQAAFLKAMRKRGALAGVARSVEDAKKLIA